MESPLVLTSSMKSLGIQALVALPPGLSPDEAWVCHKILVACLWDSEGITSQTPPSPLPLMAEAFTLPPSLNLGILPATPSPPLPIANIANTRGDEEQSQV